MASIPTDWGTGGRPLNPKDGTATQPSLATVVRGIVTDLAANMAVPVWSAEQVVAAHTVTLATAGWVVAVDATTATAAGGKIIQSQATPAAGFVQVEYDAAGIATLTFEATDAVTGAKVALIPYTAPTITNA